MTDNRDLKKNHRKLPHWRQGGATYFVTFSTHVNAQLNEEERQVVIDSVRFWNGKKWYLHVICVMPNHVHLIVTMKEITLDSWFSLSEALKSAKSFSAKRINSLRHTKGQVWQRESFDRIIRNEFEYLKTLEYVLHNSVEAGLVEDPYSHRGFWWDGKDSPEVEGESE